MGKQSVVLGNFVSKIVTDCFINPRKEAHVAKDPKKPRQSKLDGFSPKAVEEIVAAAEEYKEKIEIRMRAGEVEAEAHEKLATLMRKHKQESLVSDDLEIVLTTKEKVKVKRLSSD